jgi:CubicO group peptidase (beta-lactamase class C family)
MTSVITRCADAPPAHLSTRVQTIAQQALDQGRLVGAVVLVARDGKLIHHQAYGWADHESRRAMTVDTVFRLASVSKPIVSTAALVLVAQGRMGLDDSIHPWLPEFRPSLADGRPAQITVRQLLSHTAGLGYRFLEADAQGPYARAGVSDGMDATGISLEENLRRIATVPLLYEPGTAWGYSLAIDVLGALIEQVYGAPLEVAVSQLVTGPLRMVDTAFIARDAQRVATAYVNGTPQPHPLREGETVSPFEGAVGIPYSPARIFDPQAFPSGGSGHGGHGRRLFALAGSLAPRGRRPAAQRHGRGNGAGPDEWLRTAGCMPGFGFGLGFFGPARPDALAASPESNGTWRWGGAYGHSWFVDRAQGLAVVAFTNTLYEGMSGRFVTDLRDAVYGAPEAGR